MLCEIIVIIAEHQLDIYVDLKSDISPPYLFVIEHNIIIINAIHAHT